MLQVSDKFKNDIEGNNNFLIPLVVFEWDSGHKLNISTNSLTLGDDYYSPLLMSLPSLTESIGIQSKKYKISSITLKISNYKYNDVYFSDSLYDNNNKYIIGNYCNIYYKSQSSNNINDCLQIYKGVVRDIRVTSDFVSIRLEDLSQGLFYKDIPKNKLSGGLHILEDYRNQPYPMVYGDIDRSPCIIGDLNIVDENFYNSTQVIAESDPDIEILNNLDDIILNAKQGGQNGTLTFPDPKSYVMLYSDGKYASINQTTYDNGKIGKDKLDPDTNEYYNDYLQGDQTNIPSESNNKNIVTLQGRASGVDNKTNLIAEDMAECFYVSTPQNIKNWGDEDYFERTLTTYSYRPTVLPFSGNQSINWVHNDNSDIGKREIYLIRHNFNMKSPPAIKEYKRIKRLTQGYVTGLVRFSMVSPYDHPDFVRFLFGYMGFTGTLAELAFTNATSLFGDGSSQLQFLGDGYNSSHPDYNYRVGDVGIGVDYIFNHYSKNLSDMFDVDPIYNVFDEKDTNSWTTELSVNNAVANTVNGEAVISDLDLDLKVINLYHAKDISSKKLFCKVNGRRGLNNDLNPPSIIIDIIQREILDNQPLDYNADEYSTAIQAQYDWKYAFTIFERENSKKIIENIAKESKSFIYVNNLSNFSFITMIDKYDIESYTDNEISFLNTEIKGHYIDTNDIISYSMNRTRLRDIKTKIELLYHYDYGHKNHLKTTADNNIPQTAIDLYPDYDNNFYGILDQQGDSPIELDYIRDDYTANELHRYLLAYNCNQHTIFKLRLPLKYVVYEIGDVIAFKELIDGRKAYSEDYSFNYRALDNKKIIRNGQEIHPFFIITKTKKTLDYIDIEAIQLHNLTNIETGDLNVSPTALTSYELSNDGMDTPPDVFDVSLTQNISITLDGSSSIDPNDDDLNYEWIYDSSKWSIIGGGISESVIELEYIGNIPLNANDSIMTIFKLKVDDGNFSNISNPIRIYIINNSDSEIVTISQTYASGWNLVSLPVYPLSYNYYDVFPESVLGSFYGFNQGGVYTQMQTLELGKGYLLRFDNETTVTFIGRPINSLDLNITEGWNLIGSISNNIDIEDIQDPDNIRTEGTPLYSFNNGSYNPASSIFKGKGYWLVADAEGVITL